MFLEQFRGRKKDSEASVAIDSQSAPAGLTDKGCRREANEDRYLILESSVGAGYFVFDGMGGAPGGEAAAHISQEATRRVFAEATPEQDTEAVLRAALTKAHQSILMRRGSSEFSSMGTTVVGATVTPRQVVIASVGDSRAYVMNEGTSEQLTCDHTFVQQLVDEGHIQPQDALLHPQAHILTRCIGSASEFELDIRTLWIWPVESGSSCDTLLLCSDGLYSLVTDEEMACIVAALPPPEACEKLIALARERGGYDNITALIVPLPGKLRVEPLDEPPVKQQRMATRSSETSEKLSEKKRSASRTESRRPVKWRSHIIALSGLAFLSAAITLGTFVFWKLLAN